MKARIGALLEMTLWFYLLAELKAVLVSAMLIPGTMVDDQRIDSMLRVC